MSDTPRTFDDPSLDDDTFAGTDADGSPDLAVTDLDRLRQEVAAELADEAHRLDNITLEVASRPGYAVVLDPNIDAELLGAWEKKAASRGWLRGVDPIKLACTALANQTRGIRRNGVTIRDADGEPWTFRHRELLETLGVRQGREGVRALYGRDALLLQHYEELMATAGLEDTVGGGEDEGPTDAP